MVLVLEDHCLNLHGISVSFVYIPPSVFLSFLRCQALGVCSHSDRSVLKKKLKEMKKSEERGQRRGEKKLKEEKEKEKNAVLDKESEEKEKARMMMEGKSLKDVRCSVKTVRTESLL